MQGTPADGPARRVQIGEFLVQQGLLGPEDLLFALRVQRKLRCHLLFGDLVAQLRLVEPARLEEALERYRRSLSVPDLLVGLGLMPESELERALDLQRGQPERSLERILIEEKLIDEQTLLKALSAKLGIPVVTPHLSEVDQDLLHQMSLPELRKLEVLPLRARNGDPRRVAMRDPRDEAHTRVVSSLFGADIRFALATSGEIQAGLDAIEVARRARVDTSNREVQVVALFDRIVAQAYAEGVSDVHLEPAAHALRVRFRIDGVLRTRFEFPRDIQGPLISRVKVLAEVDVAERRRHQDGRMRMELDGRGVDLRASFYVTIHGEAAALRILGQRRGLLGLEELGLAPRVLQRYVEEALEQQTGVVVVTGPTGCGKTTSMASSVSRLNRGDIKIVTAEDPVEYQIEGITQCQIHPQIGLTYEETLRAIVRQDPDVVVLGEIRDRFSADVAINASLTGHKVFTTFHTEDSVGALLRLIHTGIEPFFIASTVLCVLGQRLLRRSCPDCARPYRPTKDEVRRAGLAARDAHRHALVRGGGCEACTFSGYRGRLGVFEMLMMKEPVRDQLMTNPTGSTIRDAALRCSGLVTLREDALAKAVRGQTTLEEVARHTPPGDRVRSMEEVLPLLGY